MPRFEVERRDGLPGFDGFVSGVLGFAVRVRG